MGEVKMPVINPCSAGVDVGSRFHMVAIDQNPKNVREFGVYTNDHIQLINYLKEHAIQSVAMESTGNYWQTLFDALQRAGFEVLLVNGNQTKNVKGKKTDTIDCMWIQKLHSMGILSSSFLPSCDILALRTYYSHRQYLISQCSKYTNKMQKALRLMNIRLDIAVNDIMGLSGRTIIEAILAGQTDATALAALANNRVRKSKAEIALALEGNRRDDLLFELKECLSLYDFYCQKIRNCDQELENKIKRLLPNHSESDKKSQSPSSVKRQNKHTPQFNVETLSAQYYGVNLMSIPNIGANTVLCLLSCVGNDIYKFPSSKHFCSWLRLAPNNQITGGKIISSKTPKGKNRLAIALRQAASSLNANSKSEMVHFFKRVAYKKGRAAAITATARKLATVIYNMIMRKEAYAPAQPRPLSAKIKNKIIQNIRGKLNSLQLSNDQLTQLFTNSST
jgi:transposase